MGDLRVHIVEQLLSFCFEASILAHMVRCWDTHYSTKGFMGADRWDLVVYNFPFIWASTLEHVLQCIKGYEKAVALVERAA